MFDKNIAYNDLPLLPWKFNYEDSKILKLALKASEEISKLNGLSHIMPNLDILISPLLTKESVESSAIENINTTTLKVLQSQAIWESNISWAEKEVLSYHNAILEWLKELNKYWGLWYNSFINIQKIVEPNKTGVRKIPWTIIADWYWEAIYTPPEWKENIDKLLRNLEDFMNNFDDDIDPLIKMPVLHYQFESIHPFYDWNGRTWRILNILYLILWKKLDFPILFLSEYINKNKAKYYKLLNNTTKTGDYTDFVIYLLEAIIEQSKNTSDKILKIKKLIDKKELDIEKVNQHYHKITSLFFSHPFMTISEFTKKLWFSRQAVTKYINILEENNIISSVKIWRNKLIFISEFIDLLN
jgi:Fic family protein